MTLQQLIDTYYHTAYDRIWSDTHLSDIQKADSDLKAWNRARDRILRETNYDLRNDSHS